MFARRIAVLGAALVLASGCSVLGIDSDLEAELKDQRRAWLSQGLMDYSYEFQRSCFCPSVGPVIITVRDDEVTGIVVKETGEPVTQYLEGYMTITDLYDYLVESAGKSPHQMAVSFDNARHIPTLVTIDFEQNVADDELGLELSNLTII
jgi:hypothetical protein